MNFNSKRVTLVTIIFFGLCILAIYICFENTQLKEFLITLASLTGAVAVFIQIKRTRDLATGEFILNLQQEFIVHHSELFIKCWNHSTSSQENLDLKGEDEHILNYLTFFESMFIMVNNNVLNIKMLDDLFGRRFFMVVNNKSIQKWDLEKNYLFYLNIYRLYAKWKKYRKRKNEEIFDEKFCQCNEDLESVLEKKVKEKKEELQLVLTEKAKEENEELQAVFKEKARRLEKEKKILEEIFA